MAYTAPTTLTTGTLITATIWNTDVVDNIAWLHTAKGCRVYHNTTQSVANTTVTPVAFNSERQDTDSFHDTATNNTRLTVPSGLAGFYYIYATLIFDSTTTNGVRFRFRLDGSTYLNTISTTSNAQTGATISLSTGYYLTVGQYVEITAYQSTGSSKNIGASGNESPEFGMIWLGS